MRTAGRWLHGIAAFCLVSCTYAMDVEIKAPFVFLSGKVTGNEQRILQAAIEEHPGITTVVLKNSSGGDARAGYATGEYIREKGLMTLLSGYCRSSCSRMFLGGITRAYSDDQPLDRTVVAFHGNYAQDGSLQQARMPALKAWIMKYSDGRANPQLVEQWVNLPNHHGFAYFYHPQADGMGPDGVMLCQGNEDPKLRRELCAKPQQGDALANGIVTTLEIVKIPR
jgi:hypothetical protein